MPFFNIFSIFSGVFRKSSSPAAPVAPATSTTNCPTHASASSSGFNIGSTKLNTVSPPHISNNPGGWAKHVHTHNMQSKTTPTTPSTPHVNVTDGVNISTPYPMPTRTPPRAHTSGHSPQVSPDSTETSPTERAKAKPVPHSKRRVSQYPKKDYAAEIVIENDDSTLPDGYIGTWCDFQFYTPKDADDSGPSCSYGRHELACDHWVLDDAPMGESLPCGINCKKPSFDYPAFCCLECRKIIDDILATDLTEFEKQKLDMASKSGSLGFVSSYMTEIILKRNKIHANVTEVTMSICQPEYGRKCEQVNAPEPVRHATAQEMAQMIGEAFVRHESKKQSWLDPGKKRKESSPSPADSPNDENSSDTSDAATDTDPNPRSPKHHKRKLLSLVPATKRPVSYVGYCGPPIKNQRLKAPIHFGEASFAAPGPNVIGPLLRKRNMEAATVIADEEADRRMKRVYVLMGDKSREGHKRQL
ncbi:hypothetical protein EJ04DRAFT_558720 [Polyplosphaeria fusca]|uniref:Uncharacterized protein n=1 Tax=Polyplosphaeria fusca TaxID=682080 RepID=A0A9P4V5J9_9PLEO|nr:hypothetical protein EJ04DRAFT_558720 [Polyplosphaeria fusca]